MYQFLANSLKKFIKPSALFKHGFNLAPMYRRSTGRLDYVSEDLFEVKVKIPISWKNRNYVGTIFGGSMASATDPIYMIQLINILGNDFVVWDKEATIRFKKPANNSVYADFKFTIDEIERIKEEVKENKKMDLIKKVNLTSKDGEVTYAEVIKTIYIADKEFYKKRRLEKTS